MHYLPKEFGGCWRGGEDHLRAATRAQGGATDLRFDLSGALSVPLCAGRPLLWRGHVVHWGGRCSARATRPRISIGCTFRAANVQEVRQYSYVCVGALQVYLIFSC